MYLQICPVAPVLARLTYPRHWCGKQSQRLSESQSQCSRLHWDTQQTSISSDTTQNLGKNGMLPPLDSLILNSVTVMRYHMPFKIRKSCGVRTWSIFLLGRNFIFLFGVLLAFSKAKPQQHNPTKFWTKKDWLNEWIKNFRGLKKIQPKTRLSAWKKHILNIIRGGSAVQQKKVAASEGFRSKDNQHSKEIQNSLTSF